MLARIDSLLDTLLGTVCFLIFCMGFYCLRDAVLMENNERKSRAEEYRPESDMVLEEAGTVSDEQIGWLTLTGTPVDLPVMQAENNYKYLNTDPYGEYAASGSLFLDFRNAADLGDSYSIIYGHHMENDGMFGALDHYRDAAYIREHQGGTLTLTDRIVDLKIFCVMEADARDLRLFTPTDIDTVLAAIADYNPIWMEMPGRDPILALSTCTGSSDTIRLMVLASVLPLEKDGYDEVIHSEENTYDMACFAGAADHSRQYLCG